MVTQTSLLLFALIFSFSSFASVLVLEFKGEEHTTWHGEEVEAIACGIFSGSCETKYTGSFNHQVFSEGIFTSLAKASVVNMSFSIFAPHAPRRDIQDLIRGNTDRYEQDLLNYNRALSTFNEEKDFLKNLISQNNEKLFVIAAGNGFALEAMTIPGMILSERYPLYPSLFTYPNTLKVAALEASQFAEKQEGNKLAFYSTYSTEFVDIAAPVPLNRKGERQRGTSFAAPWVSAKIASIMEKHPSLTITKLKKIVMRSAYIPNIRGTLNATKAYIENGAKSLLYRAQHEKSKSKREALIKELGEGILFVKSGGFLHPAVLAECARVVANNPPIEISSACLEAHQKISGLSVGDLKDLRELWKLRKL